MDLAKEKLQNTAKVGDPDDQAVILYLQFPSGKFKSLSVREAIFELDAIFAKVVETSRVGVYDGNELCESLEGDNITFFFYGSDATQIYNEIEPILGSLPNLPGSYISKCFSRLYSGSERVTL